MSQQQGWRDFLKLCQNVSSESELHDLLYFFFTPEEREQLALRVELIAALLSGDLTQREIAAQLHVSIAKITRGSNAMKEINTRLHEYLKKQLVPDRDKF